MVDLGKSFFWKSQEAVYGRLPARKSCSVPDTSPVNIHLILVTVTVVYVQVRAFQSRFGLSPSINFHRPYMRVLALVVQGSETLKD